MSTTNSGLLSLFDSIVIILSTPYLIAALVGVVLNLILPAEEDDAVVHANGIIVHPDDLVRPSIDERERRDEELELDDKKFAHEPGSSSGGMSTTLSREVV